MKSEYNHTPSRFWEIERSTELSFSTLPTLILGLQDECICRGIDVRDIDVHLRGETFSSIVVMVAKCEDLSTISMQLQEWNRLIIAVQQKIRETTWPLSYKK